MSPRDATVVALAALLPCAPQSATGQERGPLVRTYVAAGPAPQEASEGSTLIRFAKWAALTGTAAAAAYGFTLNAEADDEFARLEDVCEVDPSRCLARNPDGSYADPLLEGRYQSVLDKDDRARTALWVSQIGLVTTAVLFILDLRDRVPADIPFEPPKLRRARAGWTLESRIRVGWP